MDDIDKQLLNTIQADFPICPHPYEALGERLGIPAGEALSRVQALAEAGVVRRLGASFDSRMLGHTSTLAAARIPAGRLEEVAEVVSSFPQVTHNYGRDHEYNLWFTLICRDSADMERVLAEISARTGISDLHPLPAEKMFKIRVEFAL